MSNDASRDGSAPKWMSEESLPDEALPDVSRVGPRLLEALLRLGRLAVQTSDLEPLMREVNGQLIAGTEVDVAEIWVSQADSRELRLASAWGWADDVAREGVVPVGPESQVGFTLHCGLPVVVADLTRETRFFEASRLRQLGIASTASALVNAGGEALGVLCLYSRRQRLFDEAEVQFIQAAGSVLGLGVQWHRKQEALRENQRYLLAGIVRDLVERRGVETALQRTEERYRALQLQHTELERVAVAGELAGIVAHEIRTPLNALSINVQMIERTLRRGHKEDLQRARGLVGTLRGEIDRINNLLKDYLQVLRRPARSADELFVLDRVVEDAIRFVEPKAMSSSVSFELALSPAVKTLRGDEDRLRQVLLNLLLNAIQAMPDGGTVTVSTALEADRVSLKIRDTGPGIAQEELERIFQPFVTSKEQGTGLGLAISSRLIRAMGGSIGVTSSLSEGACFEICLPLVADIKQAIVDDEQPEE